MLSAGLVWQPDGEFGGDLGQSEPGRAGWDGGETGVDDGAGVGRAAWPPRCMGSAEGPGRQAPLRPNLRAPGRRALQHGRADHGASGGLLTDQKRETREVLSIRWAPHLAHPTVRTTSVARSTGPRTRSGPAFALVSPGVEPSAGIEPATPSLPFVLPRSCRRVLRSSGQECPWLTVANRRRRAGNGTEMARPVRTTASRTWSRWHQLGRWVRPVQVDTSLVG